MAETAAATEVTCETAGAMLENEVEFMLVDVAT